MSQTPFDAPPAWAKDVIWYQIFTERFFNGDAKNDPVASSIESPAIGMYAPKDWAITPWTQNWYKQEPWAINKDKSFHYMLQYRRYGGDIQGIINKLDYLKDLGINAIFLNPMNDAASLHKYDARNYHHIDIHFGPDPAGDIELMKTENPADPSTWVWTSADKLFLQLVDEIHLHGMKVIMDYSWNHTGTSFWAWQDILKNQSASEYKDWYDIISFDDANTPTNEFKYKGWLNVESLPELKKTNITTTRINGHPYEGDINPGAKAHIFSVTKRWLSPNGNTQKGIDGFRLDVADQIGLAFWRDFRKEVRSINPNAYLVGEIWWETWPDKLMNPAPYTQGDIFDAVMFYQAYKPARYFFAKTNYSISANELADSLQYEWNRLRVDNRYAMMNVSSSHDAPRLLTCFANPNKYKFKSNSSDDASYITGKPNKETYQRVRLYLVHLFTSVGVPQIWNGEEMGMWGADDPDCRKPLWWPEYQFEKENSNNFLSAPEKYGATGFNKNQYAWYKKLIQIRKENKVLVDGNRLPRLDVLAEAIVKGDAKVKAISAASILAKVHRDRWCIEFHQQYPQYGFDGHKGYGTAEHLAALREHGACPQHRKSFAPVAVMLR